MTKQYLITDGEFSDYRVHYLVEGPDDLPELLRLARLNLDSFVDEARAEQRKLQRKDYIPSPKNPGMLAGREKILEYQKAYAAWQKDFEEKNTAERAAVMAIDQEYGAKQRAFFEANFPGQPFSLLGILQGLGCVLLERNEVNIYMPFIGQTDEERVKVYTGEQWEYDHRTKTLDRVNYDA